MTPTDPIYNMIIESQMLWYVSVALVIVIIGACARLARVILRLCKRYDNE